MPIRPQGKKRAQRRRVRVIPKRYVREMRQVQRVSTAFTFTQSLVGLLSISAAVYSLLGIDDAKFVAAAVGLLVAAAFTLWKVAGDRRNVDDSVADRLEGRGK
jgi:hypothetical protein